MRVLHAAVRLCGIADTRPITPFWSSVTSADEQAIEQEARKLLRGSSLDSAICRGSVPKKRRMPLACDSQYKVEFRF